MDQQALAAAAGRYRDMIWRVALNWCGHTQEAEDVTQEVLLKLCTTRRRFESEEHLRSWLLRVTVNQCKSWLRAPWRTRRVPLDELPDAADPQAFADPTQQELYQAVMALPAPYRVVLYLFYYEDLPTGQIAALLHLSQSAVTTRLSRARALLRAQWKED